jgi:hypothetical protein
VTKTWNENQNPPHWTQAKHQDAAVVDYDDNDDDDDDVAATAAAVVVMVTMIR